MTEASASEPSPRPTRRLVPWLRERRRILLLVMGLLDAFAAGYWWRFVRVTGPGDESDIIAMSISYDLLLLILVVMLCFSAYGLSRGRRWAMMLYFWQVPLRIACGVLTLGMIMDIIDQFDLPRIAYQMMGILILLAEIFRLVVTIIYYRMSRPKNPVRRKSWFAIGGEA